MGNSPTSVHGLILKGVAANSYDTQMYMFCVIEITIKPRHSPNGYRNKILSIAFNVTKLIAF